MSRASKRGRGRPHGTGLNDDKSLQQIADLLLRNPSLRPTTAIKQVMRNPGSATIRRLQVKWKAQGEAHLGLARERRDAEIAARPLADRTSYGKIAMATGAMRGMGGTLAIFDALNSPSLQAIREAIESPTMQAMREIQNGSIMGIARESDKISGMRLMREFWNSPQMRIMQEMDKIRRLTYGY